MKRRQFSARALAALAVAPALVRAQAGYPDRPIRFIVPSPPGGGTDGMTRAVAGKLTELLGWQFVVDNRPGAGGNLGLDAGAKAAPDGYTIVMGESANLAINPSLYRKMPLDVTKDIVPVALVGTVPLVLVIAPGRPYDTPQALAAGARQKQLVFASSGNGTVGHLVGEMWQRAIGANLLHVPYKGAAPVMTDLVAGQVDLHFASLPAALPLVKAGKLRALGVTSAQRLASLPDAPTMAEAGFPGFEYQVFYGVVAPAGTPAAIVQRLNTEINRALQAPEVRASLAQRGADLQPGSAEQFGAFLAAQRVRWARAVKESGATVD